MTTQLVPIATRDLANLAYYERQAHSDWRGVPMDKCATDLLVYQEMLHALRPEVVIEIGAWYGGSALFFADMCELIGCGQVLSVDIKLPKNPPQHPRLTFLEGDSADPATVQRVQSWARGRTGVVILDSAHAKAHVLAELRAYHDLVRLGCYLIVEDTNVNGHPVRPDFGEGPWEAVQEWLNEVPGFAVDSGAEPYITFCPGGYLCRVGN